MVLLAACLGFVFGLQVAASPTVWQHEVRGIEQVPRAILSRSCSVASFANVTNFVLREYNLETVFGPGNSTSLRGTLGVENPHTGETYRLYRIPISTGGGVWSVCRAGQEAPLPSQLAVCQYLIERRNGRIGFRFSWYCDGEDATKPLVRPPAWAKGRS
ncbi:hypothetical protein OQA88_2366 [Cercophora sp. LCS_1]